MVSKRCAWVSRRVVDVEVVEEAARDVAAGRAQPRAVRIVVRSRDDEQELGEGEIGRRRSRRSRSRYLGRSRHFP